MESHILNSYHQARYRTIGHKILRAKSESPSSGSSNQNSPEYAQIVLQRAPYGMVAEDSNGKEWGNNNTMNTTQSSQDTSSDDDSSDTPDDTDQNINKEDNKYDELQSDPVVVQVNIDDEEEQIDVEDENVEQELNMSVRTSHGFYNGHTTDATSLEENTLVEGHDYDVITVYTVNPDLDLIEASSEDEDQTDYAMSEKVEEEYENEQKPSYNPVSYAPVSDITSDIDLNLDTPVVSNVDEYFIKEKGILDVDGPVVKDVDEYFIKNKGKEYKSEESVIVPNVDDFFIKHKLPEEESTQYRMSEHNSMPHVDDFLVIEKNIKKETVVENIAQDPKCQNKDPLNESDLEILPNIEDFKRYLLEEMTYTKFKSIQRSCSLPQSPIQNICMDIDDAKTCLSFEDLNLDLSDLAFDNCRNKSESTNKSDDIPRTLTDEDVNSFLITEKTVPKAEKVVDDLNSRDMDIEELPTGMPSLVDDPLRKLTSTPIPSQDTSSNILNFCIEKTIIKKENVPFVEEKTPVKDIFHKIKKESQTIPRTVASFGRDIKSSSLDMDEIVDVESCNDTVISVLEANNLSSLLEQFEATEKLNKSKKPSRINISNEQKKQNKNSLTNGMRLQDAGVQLNKNKMRQILMPSTINTAMRRSPSPVHSDHDYCSSKKRHSLPNLRGGQSLLKPEVLSSNNRILSSRHRTCKNKKIIYNLSSDDESESKNVKNKKNISDNDFKKKTSVKPALKPPAQSNCRKKLSPTHSVSNDVVINDKSNNSVINKSASKASDTPCSQIASGSLKLTIKNKSEVILSCDHKDSQKDKLNNLEKSKSSSNTSDVPNAVSIKQEKNVNKNIKLLDRNKTKSVNNAETVSSSVKIKEEPRPKDENFYTALFNNKQDLKLPLMPIKTEKSAFEEELSRITKIKKEEPKKKKLNLQEYKLRKCVSSNNSSATVSPEAIFPDLTNSLNSDKTVKPLINPPTNGLSKSDKDIIAPKKIFDPIREASRKILMNTKKHKAEAMRKRDEDIVMSKIPKVENLELQPLISDAEMMKIVGMTQPEALPAPEKPHIHPDYEELVLVSVGTNTDESIFRQLEAEMKSIENTKRKSQTPPLDPRLHINFKIKKSDHVLKRNVFDAVKKEKRSPLNEKKHVEQKIDKERYKDITATLKSVGKQVDSKMSSNSLFASIQDVVLKKAPHEEVDRSKDDGKSREDRHSKPKSPTGKREVFKFGKPIIVRDFDTNADHGEDKIILHLGKHKSRPASANIIIQTDPVQSEKISKTKTIAKEKSSVNRRRNNSDMSISSDVHDTKSKDKSKVEDKVTTKARTEVRREKRSTSKEKRSRSRDRYEAKYRRRSRSVSRSRRRRRSHSRSRSRSHGRYRRYRRSDSHYKRKRRSGSRSYHKRCSPSARRDHRYNRSRSRSRPRTRSKSPVAKKSRPSPQKVDVRKSTTPPLRKPTVSESSDSSICSSSSSSSSSSSDDSMSGRSCHSNRDEMYRVKDYRSFSPEDMEIKTPVEERRIVFVGKLDKDTSKLTLKNQFSKFGTVLEVRLHTKEDGTRYGFITYQRARDAWTAVESASTFPQYDVGFGGRRAFCRQSYADLDGLEAKYSESAFHGASALPGRRVEDMSFEQMLLDVKKKLSQMKGEKKRDETNL